mgnify:CR=1 FL=1
MKKKNNSRKRIYDIIQIGSREDLPSRAFDYTLIAVIVINICSIILESFEALPIPKSFFKFIDIFSIAFFLIEYILRIATADYQYPDSSRIVAVLKYMVSFDGIIALLTILPFYYLSGFVVFRILRVVRILRLFRINSSYDSIQVIGSVFIEKKTQIQASIMIILMLMLASSICMYSVENEVQPEAFPNALSGIWWASNTIFTVGYGDVYPITLIGKIIGVIINFLAMGVIAIPTGIISAGFVEKYTMVQRNQAKGEEKEGLITITVSSETPYIGKEIGKAEDRDNLDILVLIRDGVCVIPTRNIVLKNKDILVCRKTD